MIDAFSARMGNTEALYTAPAGLERHSGASSSLASSAAGLEPYATPEMPSRVFSADLGLSPCYYTQPGHHLWRQVKPSHPWLCTLLSGLPFIGVNTLEKS